MADSRVFGLATGTVNHRTSSGGRAGTISRIRLENFMCHNNLQIEFGDHVNFVTGQNGSGKSAILTALCIAFGCRARSTQRAATIKDFIKTGCHYAVVIVEIENQGDDAFKPEVFGHAIIIERRISESSSSILLKDYQGKKVATGRDELHELVEHFNIDVENPCVIMSQDKSREFLHSGSSKDKFKFFFKATLLQQVDELLQNISKLLGYANGLVGDMEKSIEPIEMEIRELQGKIKSMEHIKELSEEVEKLKKKLAWSWVYEVDKQLEEQRVKIEKLQDKVPACEARIKKRNAIIADLRDIFLKKKTDSDFLVQRSSELQKEKNDLHQKLSLATKERLQLEEESKSRMRKLEMMAKQLNRLREQARDIQDEHLKNTQAEESEMEKKLNRLEEQHEAAHSSLMRLKEEEDTLLEMISTRKNEIREISNEIEANERKRREICYHIRELQQHQTNKATAFGGGKILQLLSAIESRHRRFRRPPIGPIGAHVNLRNGDEWSFAVENAVGRLLNSFIVTDHKDFLLLKECAAEASFRNLPIVIYDFSRTRLNIPHDMLPDTEHQTVLSVLCSENPIVANVLVDLGSAERQVLVPDYETGKTVAFGRRIPNLKEVYTRDGYKMFSRGSAQTILPPNRMAKSGRLSGSYAEQIQALERDASSMEEQIQRSKQKRKSIEIEVHDSNDKLHNVKRRRQSAERDLSSKKLALQDLKSSLAAEASSHSAPSVDELTEEISKVESEMKEKQNLAEKLVDEIKAAEEKVRSLKASFEEFCESAKITSDGMEEATNELSTIERQLQSAELEKAQLEKGYHEKLLPTIKEAEERLNVLEKKREVCKGAVDLRQKKFQRNATLLKRQLTWQFNAHLRKKGISGNIKVSYEEKTLSIEVKMPQDASSTAVRDTRGLSGGERSFSTLCFALALHEMIEAPFRAMDEFDVFMDAVSRKISLDTLVDFALSQGSQWIFITPHDISMVKQDERVKKQQMAAPRS